MPRLIENSSDSEKSNDEDTTKETILPRQNHRVSIIEELKEKYYGNVSISNLSSRFDR